MLVILKISHLHRNQAKRHWLISLTLNHIIKGSHGDINCFKLMPFKTTENLMFLFKRLLLLIKPFFSLLKLNTFLVQSVLYLTNVPAHIQNLQRLLQLDEKCTFGFGMKNNSNTDYLIGWFSSLNAFYAQETFNAPELRRWNRNPGVFSDPEPNPPGSHADQLNHTGQC